MIAHKGMLAARSPVFRRLLFDHKQQQQRAAEASSHANVEEKKEHDDDDNDASDKQSVLTVNYSSQVMRAVVEYIYSDDATVFHGSNGGDAMIAIVPTLVGLVDAATFYQLPNLRSKAEAYVGTMLSRNPLIAIPIMVACQSHGKAVSGMHNLCHKMIRSSPRIFLQGKSTDDKCHLSLLSVTQIEDLLKDGLFEGDELTLFFILKAWTVIDNIETGMERKSKLPEDLSTKPMGRSTSSRSRSSKIESARQLSKYIQLEKVDPVELTEFVGNSGLVPMGQLCRAYETQALMARRKRDIKYNSPRFVDVGSQGKPTDIFGDIVSRSLNFSNLGGNNSFKTINHNINTISRSTDVNHGNNETQGPPYNMFGFFTFFCPPDSDSKHRGSTIFSSFPDVEDANSERMNNIEGKIGVDCYDSLLVKPISGRPYKEDGQLPRPCIQHVDSEIVIFETDDDDGSDDGDSHTEALAGSWAPSPNAPPPVAPPPPPVATTPEKEGCAAPCVIPHT